MIFNDYSRENDATRTTRGGDASFTWPFWRACTRSAGGDFQRETNPAADTVEDSYGADATLSWQPQIPLPWHLTSPTPTFTLRYDYRLTDIQDGLLGTNTRTTNWNLAFNMSVTIF